MSLKCSIFGHKYAAPDVERERDEQGSEVVITIRELETCERCGETRVVSENKEVTTLETPDIGEETTETAAGTDSTAVGGDGSQGDEGAVEGSARSDHVEEARDAEIIDGEPSSEPGPESGPGAAPEASPDTDSGGGTPTSPAASAGRPGENAQSRDVAADEPDPAEDDEPDPTEDDGVILEAGEESGGTASERQPGEWPQESDEETEPDWVAETEPAASTVEDRSPEIESAASAMSVPDGEFYCTECGFATKIEESSLRDGDFCPECHQGTLETRPAED